jgi:uracil-DNA glycosylase family 4
MFGPLCRAGSEVTVEPELRRQILHAVRQNLQTDALLGATDVPIPKPPDRPTEPTPTPRDQKSPPRPRLVGPNEPDKARRLEALFQEHLSGCRKCTLAKDRNTVVFGEGSAAAQLVFVGEAPGAEEDRQGRPFVGRAGQLLNRMIEAMGLTRDQVYICNVLKCRPPGNRTPSADEIAACAPYLFEQLRIIEPKIIVALGAPAAQTLLDTRQSIGQLRGQFHDFYPSGSALAGPPIKLMPTYHPAYLLRNPPDKRKAWEDLKLVMIELGLPIPDQYR